MWQWLSAKQKESLGFRALKALAAPFYARNLYLVKKIFTKNTIGVFESSTKSIHNNIQMLTGNWKLVQDMFTVVLNISMNSK